MICKLYCPSHYSSKLIAQDPVFTEKLLNNRLTYINFRLYYDNHFYSRTSISNPPCYCQSHGTPQLIIENLLPSSKKRENSLNPCYFRVPSLPTGTQNDRHDAGPDVVVARHENR